MHIIRSSFSTCPLSYYKNGVRLCLSHGTRHFTLRLHRSTVFSVVGFLGTESTKKRADVAERVPLGVRYSTPQRFLL